MIHQLKLDESVSADTLRQQLLADVKDGDSINLTLEKLSFTQTRSLLAVINTIAYSRHCSLKYHSEPDYKPPPLDAHYTHEPNITWFYVK